MRTLRHELWGPIVAVLGQAREPLSAREIAREISAGSASWEVQNLLDKQSKVGRIVRVDVAGDVVRYRLPFDSTLPVELVDAIASARRTLDRIASHRNPLAARAAVDAIAAAAVECMDAIRAEVLTHEARRA